MSNVCYSWPGLCRKKEIGVRNGIVAIMVVRSRGMELASRNDTQAHRLVFSSPHRGQRYESVGFF